MCNSFLLICGVMDGKQASLIFFFFFFLELSEPHSVHLMQISHRVIYRMITIMRV